jgi:hypothetical protein
MFLHGKTPPLYLELTKQLQAKVEWYGEHKDFLIYIEPLASKGKDGTGVYAYNEYADHFGRVNFFQYKDNQVTLLDRNNLDSLQNRIAQFLIANHFQKRQLKTVKKKVVQIWSILSTDSF